MRVVVAMSGGVDSSVAAGLLVEQGHEVIGVHMKLHDRAGSGEGTCCGLDDANDARLVADRLGMPFYVMNLREAFQKSVMDRFAADYAAGRTPNPCVECNGVLKFRVLLSRAVALGASHLATGHYARVGDGPCLMEAVDKAKDQTYFLFPLDAKALDRTLFPLGGMTKAEVRAHAERMGLVTATKAESQDICFLPEGHHEAFVAEHNPGVDASGEIVDEAGNLLGHHDGYWRFTVGQRRGVRVALGYPAYVLRIEPATRRVVVGAEDGLRHNGLVAHDLVWTARPEPDQRIEARIRHRGARIPCRVGPGDAPEIRFETPARAVTPGQAVVLYDGERVLGGGYISKAIVNNAEVAA
jgi:tRNA-specific 2-thiouridylase